jgi:hypothetical protein
MVATRDLQTINEISRQKLLSGFTGAAVLVDSLKTVIATNQKGLELDKLLKITRHQRLRP